MQINFLTSNVTSLTKSKSGVSFVFDCNFWQNHNYAVDPASLPGGVEVTHVNLNDGSCAGLSFPAMNVMSLQYHPEASPGPHDSDNGNCPFHTYVSVLLKNQNG